jgi:serine/threonine protein kinase
MDSQAKAAAAGVRVGEVLAGKYRVDGVLGAGGMGVVVAAYHLQLDERVALKFLLSETAANEEAMSRFAREARAAVKIKSEHVARVIDVGKLENGAPYIVMEFLEGSDLGAWLRQKGPMRIDRAVEFLLQACEAIAEAHSLGIVHRDLKPANLFVVRRNDGNDSVKVLDFGISKFTTGTPGDMSGTRTSVVMGSPHYMSPEQMRSSKDVDPRSDIWALGVILYELLSGQPPFMADTFPEICIKVATEAAPPLEQLRPDIPPNLLDVIATCLEKDKRNRYKDVADLASALQQFAPRSAIASVERIFGILNRTPAPVSSPLAPRASTMVAGTMGPFGRTEGYTDSYVALERRRTKNKRIVGGIGVGLTAGVLLAVGVVRMQGRASPPDAAGSLRSESTAVGAPSADNVAAARLGAAPSVAPVLPPAEPVAAPPPSESAPSAPLGEATPEPSSGAIPAAHRHGPRVTPGLAHGGAPSGAPALTQPARPTSPTGTPSPPRDTASSEPASRPAATVNCDPPFYYDANGIRIFKPECVH